MKRNKAFKKREKLALTLTCEDEREKCFVLSSRNTLSTLTVNGNAVSPLVSGNAYFITLKGATEYEIRFAE